MDELARDIAEVLDPVLYAERLRLRDGLSEEDERRLRAGEKVPRASVAGVVKLLHRHLCEDDLSKVAPASIDRASEEFNAQMRNLGHRWAEKLTEVPDARPRTPAEALAYFWVTRERPPVDEDTNDLI